MNRTHSCERRKGGFFVLLKDEMFISGGRAVAKSFAKINLTLDVLGRRENGYHDVKMIMQTVELFDLLIIDKTKRDISVSTNLKYLPDGFKNIAYKAAAEFFKYTGVGGGIKIRIKKNIPVAAGLAGGSGNAACVLCAMDALCNTNLTDKELCKIAAKLGADVPYCMMGGTYLAEGVGDILTPIAPMPKVNVLLVKPPINVSTAMIYDEIDNAKILKRPNTDAAVSALERKDVYGLSENMCNVMESVTEKMHPVIGTIKNKMSEYGALNAIMSGSGPTVFGLFDDYGKAKSAHDAFAAEYKEVFLTHTKNNG